MAPDVLGTGLAFPFAVDQRGDVGLVSNALDVEQAIVIILSTAPGERPMRPEFGCDVHRLVFERINGATLAQMERAIRAALRRWEPRIEVERVSFDVADQRSGRLLIDIGYRLRVTNDRRNLIYPFYLVPAGEHR